MKHLHLLLPVTAVFLLLSAVAHGFLGSSKIRGDLEAARVPGDVVETVLLGWQWGGVAMAAFGLLVFSGWLAIRAHKPFTRPLLGIVAAAYLGFGILALQRSFDLFMLLVFVLPGLALGVAILTYRPKAA